MAAEIALPDVAEAAPARSFFGHPWGLADLAFMEAFERFSFYGMKALLLLYLVKHHLFAEADGYVVVGAYGGMVYAVPLIGGLLADRWLGMRKAVVLGGILLCLGHLGMAYEGQQAESVNGVVHRDAFALGVFFGFSPFLGLHTILGIVFAFLLNVKVLQNKGNGSRPKF